MEYPIELHFKILALGQRITAVDAKGRPLMFVKQKLLKLKEQVDVFSDSTQTQQLFSIRADRMLDFSANYRFTDAAGNDWGSVRRKGMKSIWSAHYDIIQDNQVDMTVQEENPWKKLLESLLGEIPLLGIIAVYLLNPSYIVARPDGTPLIRITKRPAFFEGRFTLEKLNEMPEDDGMRSLLAILMMVVLERSRG